MEFCCLKELKTCDKYVFANIKEPGWGKNIAGLEVNFDATTTFAVEYKVAGNRLICLAGDCPAQTYYGDIIDDDYGKRGDYSDLNFSWVFDELDDYGNNVEYFANGMAGADFTIQFSSAGSHWAKLDVSINPTSSIETSFKIINETLNESEKFIEKDEEKSEEGVDKKIIGLIIAIAVIVIIYINWIMKKQKGKRRQIRKKK